MGEVSEVISEKLFVGSGEIAKLMRARNWSQTSVGAIKTWTSSLRTSLRILLASHCPMYLAWGENLIQFYNDAYAPLLGSTKHSATLGQSALECFSDLWDWIAPLTAFYPDHDRWYEVRTYPATNGISVYFRNVTEQIQAEEAVRQSEVRFRRIFECEMVPMGMYTKVGGVIEANNSLLNLIGYTQQELETGQINWQALTPPEYRSLDENALSEIAARGVSSPYEKVFIHKDGRRIPILIGAAVFLKDASSGVFFAIDLSDHKAAEAALQEQSQLMQFILSSSGDGFGKPKRHLFSNACPHKIREMQCLLTSLPSNRQLPPTSPIV